VTPLFNLSNQLVYSGNSFNNVVKVPAKSRIAETKSVICIESSSGRPGDEGDSVRFTSCRVNEYVTPPVIRYILYTGERSWIHMDVRCKVIEYPSREMCKLTIESGSTLNLTKFGCKVLDPLFCEKTRSSFFTVEVLIDRNIVSLIVWVKDNIVQYPCFFEWCECHPEPAVRIYETTAERSEMCLPRRFIKVNPISTPSFK